MTKETQDKINDWEMTIAGTVDRLENKQAVIRIDNGQEIIWPIDKLPEGTSEGSAIRIGICNANTETQERRKLAQAILDEIFKNKNA